MNQLVLMSVMVVAAVLGAGGQIMLKKATDILQLTPKGLLSNWYLWGFVVLYGLAVLINVGAYRFGGKVQLLYPVISLSYICAAFFAWKFLGESVSGWTWFGTVVIIFGVSIIGYGAVVSA